MPSVFTRDRAFYTSLGSLMFILILQNVITFSVNLTDNILLGGYSQASLSGAATVNQIQFILQQFTMGIGEGLVVLASQYWGQKKTEPIKKIIAIAFWCGIFLGAILFLLAFLAPHALLFLFTMDEDIIAEGMKYLYLMRFTYLIFIVTNCFWPACAAWKRSKLPFTSPHL